MLHKLILSCAALFLMAASPVVAQEDERPRIGLALSGGGARGAAHVGVLKVLEELQVPIDAIAGTSMGSIVGGLYAAGYSADEIDEILTSLDWDDLLEDQTAYRDLAFRRKEDQRRYLMDLEVGFSKRGFKLPTGLRSGQKLGHLLNRYFLPVAHVNHFDDLPIPFRAVAADIETGSAVVLEDGQLATAIRASMSIPAVLTPVDLNGQLLVDGGIAINMPADLVREMGVDLVIAVDVSDHLATREELRNLFSISDQTLTLLSRKNVEEEIERLQENDILIVPDVQDWSPAAFNEARGIIDAGEAAARAQVDTLQALATPRDAQRFSVPPVVPPAIDFIRVEGNERLHGRAILRALQVEPGDALDLDALSDNLARVFGLGVFEQARYEVVREGDETGLVLHVREKSWGPTYLRLGLEFESDLKGDASFTGLINVTRTLLNPRGGEWRNELRIGRDQAIFTELYQPLEFGGRFFLAPQAESSTDTQPIFEDGQRLAEIRVDEVEAGVDLGARLGRDGELRVGIVASEAKTRTSTGVLGNGQSGERVNRSGFRFRFLSDSTDNPAIPRRGALVEGELFLAREGLGADLDYERLQVRAGFFGHRGPHTWFGGLEGGSNLGSEIPFFDQFRFGGLLSLGGFAEDELRAPRYAIGRLGYHFQLVDRIPGLGSGVFAGVVLETGDRWQINEDVDFNDLTTSATLFATVETFFGPLAAGYGWSEDGRDSFYLSLGRAF